ncbi:hypothetical protein BJ165DRAFT_1408252 [Panaeolus papilionaceus]|nr:hypothetical protein BJ165DRAFT_1408252 [Panaeolus papilionaceus]
MAIILDVIMLLRDIARPFSHVPYPLEFKLVVRDGLWVFLILFGDLRMIFSTLLSRSPFNCSPTLISVLICRGIAKMHDLAINEAARMLPSDDEDFQLTTFIYSQFTVEN